MAKPVQQVPTKTSTAAFNANEVAAVYMSFNRNDLLTKAEGGDSLEAESLRNGFYGLSDPLNLKGVLTRFEVDYNYGANTSHFKARIINPTEELELILFSFYDEIFPRDRGTFEDFSDAAQRRKDLESVTGEADDIYMSLRESPQLPQFYIRWGYGTESQHGLSRIHKVRLTDVSYKIAANADKVMELSMVDTFTWTKTSHSFNKRDYGKQISVLDNQRRIKDPSDLLTEIISSFASIYPECFIWFDIQSGGPSSFGPAFDDLVFGLAGAMANQDKSAKLQTEINDLAENGRTIREDKEWSDKKKDRHIELAKIAAKQRKKEEQKRKADSSQFELTQSERDKIRDKLDRPLTVPEKRDKVADGTITHSIILQAYKLIFNQLGLSWNEGEAPQVGVPEGKTSSIQNSNITEVANKPANSEAQQQKAANDEAAYADIKINVKTELLQRPHGIFQPPRTRDPSQGYMQARPPFTQNVAPYYPMWLERVETPPPIGTLLSDVHDLDLSGQVFLDTEHGGPGNFPCVLVTLATAITAPDGTAVEIRMMDGGVSQFFEGMQYYIKDVGSVSRRFFYLFYDEELTSPVDGRAWCDGYWNYEYCPFMFEDNKGSMYDAEDLLSSPPPVFQRKIRQPTWREKLEAGSRGWSPIWLTPGIVNTKYPNVAQGAPGRISLGPSPDKHVFSLKELGENIDSFQYSQNSRRDIMEDPMLPYDKIPVEIPTPKTGYPPTLCGYAGENALVTQADLSDLHYPVFDPESGTLVPVIGGSWSPPPGHELEDWVMSADEGIDAFIGLEPDHETVRFLNYITSKAKAIKQDGENDAKEENAGLIEEIDGESEDAGAPEPPDNAPPPIPKNYYIGMGTEGSLPHITSVLTGIINGLNKLIIGKTTKMIVIPIDLDVMTSKELEAFKEGALKGIGESEWESLKNDKPTIVLISDTGYLAEVVGGKLLSPVYSFPELTSTEESEEPVLFLEYGTPNSIIANIEFDAGLRWLINIPQSQYALRQYNDLRSFFAPQGEGEEDFRFRDTIYTVLSERLAKEVMTLRETADMSSEGKARLEEIYKLQERLRRDTKEDLKDFAEIEEVDEDLLSLFPQLMATYTSEAQLASVIGEASVKNAKILASLVVNPRVANMLFPTARVDGADGVIESEKLVFNKGDNKVTVVKEKQKFLPRKVDYSYAYHMMGQSLHKNMDNKQSFARAMQDECWNVNITTLGIPELDVMASEFLSRLVVLKVYDARFASKQMHWLSGAYKITGIKHTLDTNTGYLTSLKLIKDPTMSISVEAIPQTKPIAGKE